MLAPPLSYSKPVTQKTRAELAEGIVYLLSTGAGFTLCERILVEHTCRECGETFEGISTERYCSNECRYVKNKRFNMLGSRKYAIKKALRERRQS